MIEDVTILTASAIAIARELVTICDALGQDIAGNHFSMGIDILSAHCDLSGAMQPLEVGEGVGHHLAATLAQPQVAPPAI